MVTWIVSHCHTVNERENYVAEMRNFIPIKIYGKCNNNPLERTGYNDSLAIGKSTFFLKFEQCEVHRNIFSARAKFYLSFENSNCEDYATEKLFHIFHYETRLITVPTVPVVMGPTLEW